MEEDELDALFKCMMAEERREVLYYLAAPGKDEYHVGHEEEEKLLSLVHNHLPRLAERGYVEYTLNGDGITVRTGPHFEDMQPLIEASQRMDTTGAGASVD